MKTQAAVVLLLLAFSVIPLALQGALGDRLVSDTLEDRALAHLDSVSDIQEERLERVLERHAERFDLIASRNSLQDSLLALSSGQNGGHSDRLETILASVNASSTDIAGVHLFTTNGDLAASTLPGAPPQRVLDWRNASSEGLRLDLFALNATGRIVSAAAGPVLANGTSIGTLVVQSDGSDILELVTSYEGLGTTGETTMAFRDEQGNARFVAPTRFDPDAAFVRVLLVENAESPSIIGLRTQSDLTMEAIDYRGERVFASVRYVEALDWAVVTKIDRDEALAPADRLRSTLVLVSVVTAFAAIVIGALTGYRLLARPVQESATYADRVRRGQRTDESAGPSSRLRLDEVAALDDAVRAMAEGLQATARYRASLLNATSHALRTPLTPLKLNVYSLQRRLEQGNDPQSTALVARVRANLERLEDSVAAFVEASRIETETGPLQLADEDLAEVAQKAAEERRDEANAQDVILDTSAAHTVHASVDARILGLAVAHALEVALRNTRRGGSITIVTRRTNGDAHILIEDTGPSLAPGTEADAFDAFPTLAEQEKVLGRVTHGLAMVRRLVEMHRGQVWIENRTDTTGTRVTIALPSVPRGRERPKRPSAKRS